MDNQNIIKFLGKKSFITGYWYKLNEQRIQDEEITDLYNRGYFTPQEYYAYMNRQRSYQYMINLFSRRMNDDYYYFYVEDKYAEGYLDEEDWQFYLYCFDAFFYEGTLDYDSYIVVLELTLRTINNNIIHQEENSGGGGDDGGGGGGDYPDEPEE